MSFNPVKRVFETVESHSYEVPITLGGALTKIGLLLGTLAGGAIGAWYLIAHNVFVVPALYTSVFVGFALSLITVFRPQAARFTAIPYALCQGVALGILSAFFDKSAGDCYDCSCVDLCHSYRNASSVSPANHTCYGNFQSNSVMGNYGNRFDVWHSYASQFLWRENSCLF